VLASTVITTLRHEKYPVLYFFYRHTIAANHQARAALRDWLAQVLEFSPPLQLELKERTQKRNNLGELVGGSVETLSISDLFGLLRTALSHVSKAYIIVDALDEMAQDALQPFLHHLSDLGEWRPQEIKIAMTSRPVAVVEKTVRGLNVLDVRLDKQRVEFDIAAYVQHRLAKSPIPPEDHHRAAETVMQRCDGLFLYAKLALDHLLEPSHGDLDEVLASMPSGLSVVYAKILEEQRSRSDIPAEMQQFMLECVTHATRPLRLLEIADLINVSPKKGDLGAAKDMARLACGPLLEILPDETVHVIHHSLTEFLNGTVRDYNSDTAGAYPVLEAGATHSHLAISCIAYLRGGCLDNVHIERRSWYDPLYSPKKQVFPPFTRYAATNWYVHAQKSARAGHDQTETNKRIQEMLMGEDLEKLGSLARASEDCGFTPLGLATFFQLTSVTNDLLEAAKLDCGMSLGGKDGPLRHAAKEGNINLVCVLLEHDADTKTYDSDGYSALHLAVQNGRHRAVQVLLEAGADPFIAKGQGRMHTSEGDANSKTPAYFALIDGNVEMVSLFMPYFTTQEQANRALQQTIERRRLDVAERLLQHPLIDINAKVAFNTPLYVACQKRDADLIEVLLKAGADPNILHDWSGVSWELKEGFNVLHALAEHHVYGSSSSPEAREAVVRRCFKLALDAGAKLDQTDIKLKTPLHVASDVAAVRCLLEAGMDPNVADRAGETLLHTTRDLDIVRLLAEKVDINAKASWRGMTPLLNILAERSSGDFEIAKADLLMDLGADASVVDDSGNGTIHHLLSSYELGNAGLSLLKRLLERGADVNLRNKEEQTPLHWSLLGSRSGPTLTRDRRKAIETLVAAGADLEAKDSEGCTPLFQTLQSRSYYKGSELVEECEWLIGLGARLETTDLWGRNALHCLAESWRPAAVVIQFLASKGIDAKATDNKGNTVWHLAAPDLAKSALDMEGTTAIAELGVDVEAQNSDGQSPLHIVVSYDPSAFRASNSVSRSDNRPTNADEETFFDHFITHCGNIDCMDRNGITPLHIALTFSEYLTRRLLEEGADPRKSTAEGLTVLHLAARSRETNTLGVLLASIKDKFGEATVASLCNVRDQLGRTALYYACASGLVQTVKMLLDAGAAIDTELYEGSPWDGCVALQDECKKEWRWNPGGRPPLYPGPDAAGVLIADPRRRKLDEGNGWSNGTTPFPSERLDEIVDLLVEREPAGAARHIDQAIFASIEQRFDHATEYFLRARGRLDLNSVVRPDDETSARLLARTQVLEEAQKQPRARRDSLATRLMGTRQYSLAIEEIRKELNGLLDDEQQRSEALMHGTSILHRLAAGGFANILNETASTEFIDVVQSQGGVIYPPLLLEACRGTQSNMDVIRVLVEKKGVDVNIPWVQSGYGTRGSTALHILVRGGRWWQIQQALPYFLSRGADLEVKDTRGVTPLAAALEWVKSPRFRLDAVEMLLDAGADANVMDLSGKSCLSSIGGNRQIYRLLMRHGATVGPSDMADAIKRRDVDLLETMLASGVDPNMRKPGKEVPVQVWPDGSVSPPQPDPHLYDTTEWYPLDLATNVEQNRKEGEDKSHRMLQLLLEYGADISARYEQTTVLHRIIDRTTVVRSCLEGKSDILNTLFRRADFDPEIKESRFGRTLLLAACSQSSYGLCRSGDRTLVRLLLDAGADVHAKDSAGQIALHLLAAVQNSGGVPGLNMQRILTAAPKLIHAVDNEGKTALHTALGFSRPAQYVRDLVKAGSNILAKVTSTGDTVLHLLFQREWVIDLLRPEGGVYVGEEFMELANIGDATKRKESLLQLLINLGADVNARNIKGETPIFGYFRAASVAAMVPSPSSQGTAGLEEGKTPIEKEFVILELFDELGVDWTAVSEQGQTLLHVAVAHDLWSPTETSPSWRARRFQFLMAKGLDPMEEDKENRTPLDIAAALGRDDILTLFKKE
jgi:ankyrin repeat protein